LSRDKKIIYLLALLWFIVAMVQAAFTGFIHDEAYYWMYSTDLNWGYFDHPPAVAWYIALGDSVLHTSLGLRLMTILSSTLVFFLLWDLAKDYGRRPVLYVLLMLSMPLITALSFMTVPDSPLLLGMLLFLWLYKRFLQRNDWSTAFLWGLSMAFLLYSKYHGILVIGLTVISKLSLLKKKKFWVAGWIGLVFFLPHIWWQIDNDFVSFKFHLLERRKEWHSGMTLNFLLTQLLIISPLITLPLIFRKGFFRSVDSWERGLVFQFWGTLFFFLLMSFRGPTEGNWTLILEVVLVILLYRHLAQSELLNRKRWYAVLLGISVILVQGIRIQLFIPLIPGMQGVLAEVHTPDDQFERVAEIASGHPVIFLNTYQLPSRYSYRTGNVAGTHTGFYYRPSQYDLKRPIENYPDSILLFGKWTSEMGGESIDAIDMGPAGVYKMNWRTGYTSYMDLRVRILELSDSVQLEIEGRWPDLVQPCFLWMVEYEGDNSINLMKMSEIDRNNTRISIPAPELHPNTNAISVHIGPSGLYPQPNGYVYIME
jgi:hypothetical protein